MIISILFCCHNHYYSNDDRNIDIAIGLTIVGLFLIRGIISLIKDDGWLDG